MAGKVKVKPNRPSQRGLGYLTVILLIAAALVIGAGHEPFKEFLGAILNSEAGEVLAPTETNTSPASNATELNNPIHIESLASPQTNVEEVLVPTEKDTSPASNVTELNNPIHIESLISAQTNVSVLNATVGDSVRIEYALVPEAMRIETTHWREMLDMICALRKGGPARRSFIFVGVGQFLDTNGRPVLRSRVETKVSALTFNRMDCASDVSASDVDWHNISEYHLTFAIPKGLKVEF